MTDVTGQNPLVLEKWKFLADKLEKNPVLLGDALENIARWRGAGRLGDTAPLDWWQVRIEKAMGSGEAFTELMQLLRDDGEEMRRMKSCSPFPGVLSREERDRFTCAWTH